MPENTTTGINPTAAVRSGGRFGPRLLLIILFSFVMLGGGFVWGVAFHRYHVFPYSLVGDRIAKSEKVFTAERRFRIWRASATRPDFRAETEIRDVKSVSPTLDLVQSIPYVSPGHANDFWTLAREDRIVPEINRVEPTVVDMIVHHSLDGEELARLPIHQMILDSPYWFLLPAPGDQKLVSAAGALDVFHTNWVTELDGSLEERGEIYRGGNLLVSIRNINAIMVIDPERKKVLWTWVPSNLTLQHNPRILPNGNFLIFDNGIDASRVIELNPLTRTIEWQYDPGREFFSDTRGRSQRLPNGNTLIIESNTGYAFEATPEGETVWRWANRTSPRAGSAM